MRELVFALQFKGKAHPVEGVEGKLAAKTSAAGQVLRTTLTAKGVQVKAESRPGPRATFESEVQMTGAGTFTESASATARRVG
jgi:hypothetical protein